MGWRVGGRPFWQKTRRLLQNEGFWDPPVGAVRSKYSAIRLETAATSQPVVTICMFFANARPFERNVIPRDGFRGHRRGGSGGMAGVVGAGGQRASKPVRDGPRKAARSQMRTRYNRAHPMQAPPLRPSLVWVPERAPTALDSQPALQLENRTGGGPCCDCLARLLQ